MLQSSHVFSNVETSAKNSSDTGIVFALQSSHVFSNVETFERKLKNRKNAKASIEPRFFKRGNFSSKHHRNRTQTASIEPRFFKRGNGKLFVNVDDVDSSFNRATFFQTWKLIRSTKTMRILLRRFNRATFFQTWKHRLIGQRMPCVIVASIEPRFFKRGNYYGCGRTQATRLASIEPRFFKRGNKRFYHATRSRRTASIEPRFFKRGNRATRNEHRNHKHRSFNRATFFQTWKRRNQVGKLAAVRRLQSSHVFSNVETAAALFEADGGAWASIEPRFFKRGNL